MKRKLICLLMLLALALAAIAGCQPTEKTPEPDNGPFDASKVAVSGAAETLTAELSRYEIPVPQSNTPGGEGSYVRRRGQRGQRGGDHLAGDASLWRT
ncbi:MAG: hypothetical protein ACLRSW_05545 [Christensenellaceae bacterium]